jgi:hemerythrin
MPLLNWKDEFSVGSLAVDHEHRQLIDQINEWYDHLRKNGGIDTRLDFLGEVFAKISAHFALEEKLMRDAGYDQYAEHKNDHEELLDRLRDTMDTEESNSDYDDEVLGEWLQDWFSVHFETKDARLHGELG